jgi:hypothetical protein
MSGTDAIRRNHEPSMSKEMLQRALYSLAGIAVTLIGFGCLEFFRDAKSRITTDQLAIATGNFERQILAVRSDTQAQFASLMREVTEKLTALKEGQASASATRDEIRMQFNQVEREASVARSLAERLQTRMDSFESRISVRPDKTGAGAPN